MAAADRCGCGQQVLCCKYCIDLLSWSRRERSPEKWGINNRPFFFFFLAVCLFMSQMWIYLDSVNAECLFKECKKYTLLCKNRLKVNLLKFAVMFSQMERLFRWDSSTTARKISRPTSRVWDNIGVKVSMQTIQPLGITAHLFFPFHTQHVGTVTSQQEGCGFDSN